MSVQSVQRSFRLLEELAIEPSALTDLARSAHLPVSTTARLLKTLDDLGAVERDPDGRYRLGPTIQGMANRAASATSIETLGTDRLGSLAFQLGEIVGLSVRAGDDVLYLAQVDGPNEIQVRDWTGERVPLHTVSSGLVLLAHASPDDVERYLAKDLRRFTDATVVDPQAIERRLAEVRARGCAWTLGEFHPNINSVAAPIFAATGGLAGAIHCHGPSYRFPSPPTEESIEANIIQLASELSRALGWQGDQLAAAGDASSARGGPPQAAAGDGVRRVGSGPT